MSIQFRCSSCAAALRVAPESAGQKLRCPKCQTVVTAPMASDNGGTAPSPREAMTAWRPESVGIPQRELPREGASEPADRPRRRKVERDEEPSSLGLILGLTAGGVVALAGIVVGLIYFLGSSDEPAPDRDRDRDIAMREPPRVVKVAPPMAKAEPWGEPKERIDWDKGEPGGGRAVVVPKPEPAPVAEEPPVKITLVNGKYETDVIFDNKAGPPDRFRVAKRYEFQAKADEVYWVQAGEPFRVSIRIEGPNGPLGPAGPGDPFGGPIGPGGPPGLGGGPGDRGGFAFLVAKAGKHTISLECDRFDARPCKLTLRAMDGSEPLPTALRLKAPDVDIPRVESVQTFNGFNQQLVSYAFAPDNKTFWANDREGVLTLWEHPAMTRKGSYKSNDRVFLMAVDKYGRLYGQMTKNDNKFGGFPGGMVGPRTVGDIVVWEGLTANGDKTALPAPSKSLAVRGIVPRMINSPDGRYLYFLDVHNRKLGRIDTTTVAIDKELDTISAGARALCMTPDGKKLYCCSDANKLDIIDTARFQIDKTVKLDRGKPVDVAASNDGMVYLVGENLRNEAFFNANGMVVDLTKTVPAEAKVIALPISHNSRSVTLLPDNRAVLFSGENQVTACVVPSRPGLFQIAVRNQSMRDNYSNAGIVLSPDGRTLLHETGIMSVSR